ncbi:FAD-binding oxidoreductase [Agromyces intestinalis]|uniref:FAD-binding oxidoreductase n=1 Tax=Agromyces intestinalis TaxID=2592652 RepID=A0A5C1YIX7_9MICO|nr:FAD-binding protein [Agromyces intestinalis]QEO15475.1 FAD-binding oxidoreductase [Agromyces intestinalis]
MTRLDTTAPSLAERLAPVLGDRLITPTNPQLGALAATVFAGGDRTPALIARPRTAAETAEVVRAAAETGIPFAVRSGGHAYHLRSSVAGGLVLDTRLLDTVDLDADARIGRAGGGATAGAYTAAAGAVGLATGFGDTGSVGLAGLTLGGGIGHLSRRDGLTIDNLLAAELVLADGSVVRASADEHDDLFWAVRGGGGNFGVVTSLEFRLRPVGTVVGGFIAFERSPATLAAVVDAGRNAPDTLSIMVNAMKAPPAPFLPAEVHGRPIVAALVCFSGAPDDADAVLAPIRAAGTPIADLVRAQSYPELFAGPEVQGLRATTRTGFRDELDLEWASTALEAVAAAPTPAAVVNVRVMGGAIARIGADATAFAHRDRALMATVVGMQPDPAGPDGRDWIAGTADGLGIAGASYVNFIGDDPDGAAAAYPAATLQRLAEVKRRYDADNLFRSNHNIVPAGA